jgi:Protein of unknown function (DUF3800)
MLVCGLPKKLREERLLLMLQGYFDDSGSDGTRPPFVLAGYILPAERWALFSDAWADELKKEPRIEYFKMREANNSSGQFALVPREFIRYKVRNLLSLIHEHNVHGIDTWLLWDEFRAFNDGLIRPAKDQPYSPLFFGIMDNIVEYQLTNGIFPSKIQVDFDEQGGAGMFAIESYHHMLKTCEEQGIELDHKKIIEGTPRMLGDKDYLGLQAADMLAWCIRHSLDNKNWAEGEWGWLCKDLFRTIWPGCRRFGPES